MEVKMVSGDLRAKGKRVFVKLVKGRKIATQLQALLQNPIKEHGYVLSVKELASQIYRSFTDTLDEIQSDATVSTKSDEIAAVDCGGVGCSGEAEKVKYRRGCYKRRKSSDSWTAVSHTIEDCYGWRKYGKKRIMNSEYHRCYYRCTHKLEGCKALKQVQKIQNDPLIMYQITYFHQHTCKKKAPTTASPLIHVDSEPADPNFISFQANSSDMISKLSTVVKREPKQHSPAGDLFHEAGNDPSDDLKSTDEIPWKDIVGPSESLQGSYYDPVMMSSCHGAHQHHHVHASSFDGYSSAASSSFNGLDMEVRQLGDIDCFPYFNGMY